MGLFSSQKPKPLPANNLETFHSFVDKGSTVRGRFITEVSLRVDGTIEGDIEAASARVSSLGHQACVAISETGTVIGDIHAYRVLVAGKVEGHIYATELVVLNAGSVVNGDVTYGQIKLEQPIKHVGMLISRGNGVEAINL
jgi:cytoskeletal protein CcmA (bactofilin family)